MRQGPSPVALARNNLRRIIPLACKKGPNKQTSKSCQNAHHSILASHLTLTSQRKNPGPLASSDCFKWQPCDAVRWIFVNSQWALYLIWKKIESTVYLDSPRRRGVRAKARTSGSKILFFGAGLINVNTCFWLKVTSLEVVLVLRTRNF